MNGGPWRGTVGTGWAGPFADADKGKVPEVGTALGGGPMGLTMGGTEFVMGTGDGRAEAARGPGMDAGGPLPCI